MSEKHLTELPWKTLVLKNKVKDTGLQKALANFAKLDASKDAAPVLDALDEISDQAGKVKKSCPDLKEVAAYLDEVTKEAVRAKQAAALLAKSQAAKAQAADKAKAAAEKEAPEDEGEEEQGDFFAKLGKSLKSLKLADKPYYFLFQEAKPYGFHLSRKDITKSAQAKKELAAVSGGSTRAPKFGQCYFDGNKLVLDMDKPPSGVTRILSKWIKDSVGMMVKVQVGSEVSDEGDEAGAEAAAQPGAEVVDLAGPPGAAEKAVGGAAKEKPAGAAVKEAAQTATSQEPAGRAAKPAGAGAAAAAAAAAGAAAAGPAGAAAAGAAAPTGPFKIGGSVGKGGTNKPEDVMAVQVALNNRAKAALVVDGKFGPKTLAAIMAFQQSMGQFKPDGLVEVGRGTARALSGSAKLGPPPAPPKPVEAPTFGKPTLDKAHESWTAGIKACRTNVAELKKAVRGHYAAEHPKIQKAVEAGLSSLDPVLDEVEGGLADAIAQVQGAGSAAARAAAMTKCKAKLANTVTQVKTHKLLKHMNKTPFMDTHVQDILVSTVTQVIKSLGTAAKA